MCRSSINIQLIAQTRTVKSEISAVKRGRNQKQWQELQFKNGNIPDYENPADADTDNDYEITLKFGSQHDPLDPNAHTHDVTIRVKNVAAPKKMSAPTLETPLNGQRRHPRSP